MRGRIQISKEDTKSLKAFLSEDVHEQLSVERVSRRGVSEELVRQIANNLLGQISTRTHRMRSITPDGRENERSEDAEVEAKRAALDEERKALHRMERKLADKLQMVANVRETKRLRKNALERKRRRAQVAARNEELRRAQVAARVEQAVQQTKATLAKFREMGEDESCGG
jgi:hypothetical protein